jgi:hypothetical protein
MSKGQKGNKEAKKPKKAQLQPAAPGIATPLPVLAVADRVRKK